MKIHINWMVLIVIGIMTYPSYKLIANYKYKKKIEKEVFHQYYAATNDLSSSAKVILEQILKDREEWITNSNQMDNNIKIINAKRGRYQQCLSKYENAFTLLQSLTPKNPFNLDINKSIKGLITNFKPITKAISLYTVYSQVILHENEEAVGRKSLEKFTYNSKAYKAKKKQLQHESEERIKKFNKTSMRYTKNPIDIEFIIQLQNNIKILDSTLISLYKIDPIALKRYEDKR